MKNTQASLAEFARDVRVGLRDTAKSDLEGFGAIMQTKGYEWLGDRVAMLLASASGSRVPIADLMKTPSRTQTVKKTRAITTAAKDLSSKVVVANGKSLGSPVNKTSSSSRAPLSPLGGRNLNVNSTNVPILASSPGKSQSSKASTSKSSGKSEKAKTKATTGKKGRPKKVPDGENVVAETENSTSSRSGNSQSTQSGDLLSNKGGLKGKKGAVSESVRPPRSPQRAAAVEIMEESVDEPMEAREKQDDMIDAVKQVDGVEEQDAVEEVQDEAMPEEEMEAESIEEEPADSAAPPPSTASAPSRPKTVDLSVIAEAEEDRSSITIPSRSLPTDRPASHSSIAQSQPTVSAPIAPFPDEEASSAAPIQSETVASAPVSAPPAPPIPARHVRSSWLNKALGSGATANTQRTSDGTDRSTLVPAIGNRLSTAGFPTMRKSLAQPGVLVKRKSEVVADHEEEIEERRPEKVARVETAVPIPTAAPAAATVAASLPVPSVNLSKPIFERQPSQEIFARPGPSHTLHQSTSAAPEPITRERPSSEIDRVTKALDDMKERQQAKEVAKQKAALTSSVTAATAQPNRPKTTTGSGFLRGLGNLARSVGIGAVAPNQTDPNEGEERRRLEEEEERKAREELNEIMKKVDEPEMEEKQVEDTEMIAKVHENLAVSEAKKIVEEDELDSEEEAEVNQSIDFNSIPMNLGSPPRHTAQPQQTSSVLISTTPARLPRNQIQSTTPQGTPPRSLPALAPQRTVQQSPPRQAQPIRQAQIALGGAEVQKSTVHDRINLFNNASSTTSTISATYTAHTPSAPVPRSDFLFSPTRTAKQSTNADTDAEQATAVSKTTRTAEQRTVSPSPDTDNEADNETEEDQEEVEEEEEEEEQIEKPTTSRPVSQAGSIFGQASVIANKALGVKPAVGQVKSVQLAASAQKKDLAASERRAMIKEQRIKNKEERLAEEKELKSRKEAEEKKRKLVEMEKRKQESEARKALILKQREEKAAKERAEAEKEKAEMEKRKLASSQNRPGALQPAKRVISASSSTLSLSTGVGKMKEPAKLTKPAGPNPSAHGPSKLVPSTFRIAPAPPETPAHQMSQAGTIRLVGQTQAQPQPQATQPNQGERKPLGPPTRPSAIRASQQVQAIRQSAAVTSQQTHTHIQTSSVLAQSRLALQSQLEAEAAEIVSEDIVLPDIASEYSDSGDETDTSPAFKRPAWAESPELRAALAAQARKNPDELFGPIRPLMMEELFKQHKGKFRSRTSSGNWTRDGLKKEEEEEYARRMGFTTGTGQW